MASKTAGYKLTGLLTGQRGEAFTSSAATPEYLDNLKKRILTAYLEFAELQGLSRKPVYMRDWIAKLDDFLQLGGREILTHAGRISHEDAVKKAEFEKYRQQQQNAPSQVEKDFEAAVKQLPKPKTNERGLVPASPFTFPKSK